MHVHGRGSSAPALGAHIIFSPSTGGRPSQTGSSQASGSPAASTLLGTASPAPGPGPVGVGCPLRTLSVASDLAAPARLPIFQGSRQASCLVPELPQIQGPLSRTLSSPRPVVPQLHVHWPPAQPRDASLVWRQIARHHVGGTGRSMWAVEALRFLLTSSLHCDVLGEASGVSSAQGLQGDQRAGSLSLCEDRMVLSCCAGVEKSKSLHLCRSLFSLFSEQDVEVQEAECMVYRSRGERWCGDRSLSAVTSPCHSSEVLCPPHPLTPTPTLAQAHSRVLRLSRRTSLLHSLMRDSWVGPSGWRSLACLQGPGVQVTPAWLTWEWGRGSLGWWHHGGEVWGSLSRQGAPRSSLHQWMVGWSCPEEESPQLWRWDSGGVGR